MDQAGVTIRIPDQQRLFQNQQIRHGQQIIQNNIFLPALPAQVNSSQPKQASTQVLVTESGGPNSADEIRYQAETGMKLLIDREKLS